MTTLREAAQQALEAMEYTGMDVGKFNRINAACQALRAALAQQDEPALVQGELPPRYVARSPIQAEPVEPVATLTAQRDALMEVLKYLDKEFRQHGRRHWPEAVAARAAIKAVEETK